jgi:FG-GAP repeat
MNEDLMLFGQNSTGLPDSDGTLLPGATNISTKLLLPAIQKVQDSGGAPLPNTAVFEVASTDEIVLGRNPSLPLFKPGAADVANADPLFGYEPPTAGTPPVVLFPSPSKDFISPTLPPPPPVIDDLTTLPPLPSDQSWSQGDSLIGARESYDYFGQVTATGDFNGDGYMDLAAGVPGESVGDLEDAGAVNIIYGTASGLNSASNQIWTQDSPGVSAGLGAEADDWFGGSLATGDFNGDGYVDLAIGAPDEDISGSDATDGGAVTILYGAAGGLTAASSETWTQDSAGLDSGFGAETGDNFGQAMTAGDFNGDGYLDLAIGAPGEDVFDIADAGAVNVLYGSERGLTAVGDQIWHQVDVLP